MGLLYCREEHVRTPYYIEGLGIQVHSSQELSYVIFHHPLLVIDDFVEETLIDFIRHELDMEFLAGKLETWIKSGENPDELLVTILHECHYYRAEEVVQFRQKIAALRKLHPAEYEKNKADYLFGQKQYGNAIKHYEKILSLKKDSVLDEMFLGKVQNNLGTCYARMFHGKRALEAFEAAFELMQDPRMLKQMYYLKGMNEYLELNRTNQGLMTEELKASWKQEVKDAYARAESSKMVEKLEKLFEKDPIKRQAGAELLVQSWKQEYRKVT